MMLVYCWITLPTFFIFVLGFLFAEFGGRSVFAAYGFRDTFADYFSRLMFEVLLRFLFIFTFHTLFNWGSLLYQQGLPISTEGYISVLVMDWRLRSQTACFLAPSLNSAQQVVMFLSWF